jgi:hypothetical protein
MKCEQIRFLHRPLRDDGVHKETPRLLIIRHGVLDVADHTLRLFTMHKVADNGAREEWIFTRIRQRGTLDAYRDPAGSSGELWHALRLGRADCFYKLHRALDGAGVCISVLFAIQ